MKLSYNWLKSYVPDILEPHRLADIFTYHVCEVESVGKLVNGDYLFDLGILPNRAHDLLSHIGVARELAGLLGIPFKDPTPMYKTPPSTPTDLKIKIENDTCRRYSARIIHNVKVGPSPEWMVTHLESIGQRSINNIVDATNIVMYDCGQPTHAFDLTKIKENTITIMNAKQDSELKLVGRDGTIARLKDSDLVISSGGDILALAGVKGGFDSGVQSDTTDILIEVANFDPISVRKTARRIGQLSDSAKRFENDLSPTLCDFGMVALSALLAEVVPEVQFEDIVDVYPKKQEEKTLPFSSDSVSKILGIEIKDEDIEKIFKNYNFEFSQRKDLWEVKVPMLRLDLIHTEDIVEEIGRIYGYDKIKPCIPTITSVAKENETYIEIVKTREKLVREGYQEVMTYTFTNTGEVEVLASASDKKFMRTNLTDGLQQSYELNKLNAPFLGLNEIKIFEIGTVFTKDGEEIHVAYANKKELTETSLTDFISDSTSFDHEKFLSGYAFNSDISHVFKMWSLYPFIVRDISVWVPEKVTASQLKELYKEFGTELLVKEPLLVDNFKKDGRISYAFRLLFQSYDRTLTIEEINVIMSHIAEKVSSLGWEVR